MTAQVIWKVHSCIRTDIWITIKKTVIIRITGQDYKQMLKFPKSPLPKSRSLHLRAIFSWIILLHVETTTITHIQIYWIRIYYSFCNLGFFYLCPRNREWCWRKWNKVIETYSVLKKFNNGCCNNKNLQLIKKRLNVFFLLSFTNQSSNQTSSNLINVIPTSVWYFLCCLLFALYHDI